MLRGILICKIQYLLSSTSLLSCADYRWISLGSYRFCSYGKEWRATEVSNLRLLDWRSITKAQVYPRITTVAKLWNMQNFIVSMAIILQMLWQGMTVEKLDPILNELSEIWWYGIVCTTNKRQETRNPISVQAHVREPPGLNYSSIKFLVLESRRKT